MAVNNISTSSALSSIFIHLYIWIFITKKMQQCIKKTTHSNAQLSCRLRQQCTHCTAMCCAAQRSAAYVWMGHQNLNGSHDHDYGIFSDYQILIVMGFKLRFEHIWWFSLKYQDSIQPIAVWFEIWYETLAMWFGKDLNHGKSAACLCTQNGAVVRAHRVYRVWLCLKYRSATPIENLFTHSLPWKIWDLTWNIWDLRKNGDLRFG